MIAVLSHAGFDIRFETFQWDPIWRRAEDEDSCPLPSCEEWNVVNDYSDAAIQEHLESKMGYDIGVQKWQRNLNAMSERPKSRVNFCREWYDSIDADSATDEDVEALETFFTEFGCEDTPLNREIARRFWCGPLVKIIEPNSIVRGNPVLVGERGAGKTRITRAWVPPHLRKWFFNDSFNNERGMKEITYQEEGTVWGVMSEMPNFRKTAEIWKQRMDQGARKERETYGRRPRIYNNITFYVGTANDGAFLADDDALGDRFLCIWIPKTDDGSDVQGKVDEMRDRMYRAAKRLVEGGFRLSMVPLDLKEAAITETRKFMYVDHAVEDAAEVAYQQGVKETMRRLPHPTGDCLRPYNFARGERAAKIMDMLAAYSESFKDRSMHYNALCKRLAKDSRFERTHRGWRIVFTDEQIADFPDDVVESLKEKRGGKRGGAGRKPKRSKADGADGAGRRAEGAGAGRGREGRIGHG